MTRGWLWAHAVVVVVVAFGHACLPVQGKPQLEREPGVAGATPENSARLETSEAAARLLDDRFTMMEGNVEAALRKMSLDLEERVERTQAAYGRMVQKLWLDDRTVRPEVSRNYFEAALQKLSDRLEQLGDRIDGMENAEAAQQRPDSHTEAALKKLSDRIEQLGGRVVGTESAEAVQQRPGGHIEAALQKLSDRVEQLGARIDGMESAESARQRPDGRIEVALQKLSDSVKQLGGRIDGVEAASRSTDTVRLKILDSCVEGKAEAADEGLNVMPTTLERIRIDDRTARMETASKNTEALLARLDHRIESVEVASGSMLKSMDSIGSRIESVEAAGGNAEAGLERIDGPVESVEAASGTTEAVLRSLEGINRRIARVEANTEALLRSVETIDSRIDTVEVAGKITEAVLKSLESTKAGENTEAMLRSLESTGTRIEGVEATNRSTEAMPKSVEVTSGTTEAILKSAESIDSRAEGVEATSGSTEAGPNNLEIVDSRVEAASLKSNSGQVEALSGSKEAMLKGLEGIDRGMERVEAASRNAEATLSESADNRVEDVEASGIVAAASPKLAEASSGSMGATVAVVVLAVGVLVLRRLAGCFDAIEAHIQSGSKEALLQTPDDRLKVMEKTSAAEWDLSGLVLDGKTCVVSRPFTLAGLQGLTLELFPQGHSKAAAGHASLFLHGPSNVLVAFRLTLGDTTQKETTPRELVVGWGWYDFCKAGASFTRARVQVLKVTQKL